MREAFWLGQVSTTMTGETLTVHQGDYLTITYPASRDTNGSTVPVVYRVKTVGSYYSDITPYDMQRMAEEASWFPSRWEINRKAAIAGGQALKKKHCSAPKGALVLRSSYQGMARLPCYRGTRTR